MFNSLFDAVRNIFSGIDLSSRSITDIGVNDVIDVLIITLLMYQVMMWIKETRTWSLLKGFVIIIVIYASSILFSLNTVRWLIQTSLNVGLIALIVIFQPELRSALEQLGKGGIIPGLQIGAQHASRLLEGSKEEIIKAAVAMSKERTGAIIAIERTIVMSEYERSGVLIDARISSLLLINIFQDKTPLHDGAVIIRGDRVASACCILPLTQNDLDKRFGTRHRAAIGASEATDAYVVVVSEETGAISLAHESTLHKNLTEARLRELLPFDAEVKRSSIFRGVVKR
ncbi:MAG: diadenylate cyclase CdaA [Clostridiales bacterium]|nr:diadenylate cyclase CdaA [Clostridiales bacterium]